MDLCNALDQALQAFNRWYVTAIPVCRNHAYLVYYMDRLAESAGYTITYPVTWADISPGYVRYALRTNLARGPITDVDADVRLTS